MTQKARDIMAALAKRNSLYASILPDTKGPVNPGAAQAATINKGESHDGCSKDFNESGGVQDVGESK